LAGIKSARRTWWRCRRCRHRGWPVRNPGSRVNCFQQRKQCSKQNWQRSCGFGLETGGADGRRGIKALRGVNLMIYDVTIDGKNYRLELERAASGWRCRLDGRDVQMNAVLARRDVISLLIDGKAYEIKREWTATDVHLWVGSVRYLAELRDPRSL